MQMVAANNLNADVPFRPHPLVRHPLTQTVLSTARQRGVGRVVEGEQPLIVDAGPDRTGYAAGVRLLAYLNRSWGEETRGLVISLHGWEGCSHSVYNLVMARAFLAAGYDVARLNLRDHGPSREVDAHALNPGVFLGTLIEEAHTAVARMAELGRGLPVYLVGPSMGGNFALRIAARAALAPIPHLRRVIAISPAIDPDHSTRVIDTQPLFHRYYRSRWLRSLRAKERLFPQHYQFSPVAGITPVWEMTDWLVRRYTEYGDAAEYFARYRVTGELLDGLPVPTVILSAEDDPVIPAGDIRALDGPALLDIRLHAYGGHVGFIDLPLRRRLPDLILPYLN